MSSSGLVSAHGAISCCLLEASNFPRHLLCWNLFKCPGFTECSVLLNPRQKTILWFQSESCLECFRRSAWPAVVQCHLISLAIIKSSPGPSAKCSLSENLILGLKTDRTVFEHVYGKTHTALQTLSNTVHISSLDIHPKCIFILALRNSPMHNLWEETNRDYSYCTIVCIKQVNKETLSRRQCPRGIAYICQQFTFHQGIPGGFPRKTPMQEWADLDLLSFSSMVGSSALSSCSGISFWSLILCFWVSYSAVGLLEVAQS